MAVKLRCPSCRDTFPWETEKPWPSFCPACGFDVSQPEREGVQAPAISKAYNRTPDTVYREMEAGSEAQQAHAADLLGVSKSELSSMKITNMRDNLREGDISATSVQQAQKNLSINPDHTLFQQPPPNYSPEVQSGPSPNAGARMQSKIREMHGQIAPHAPQSDVPALETKAEGYRRRA